MQGTSFKEDYQVSIQSDALREDRNRRIGRQWDGENQELGSIPNAWRDAYGIRIGRQRAFSGRKSLRNVPKVYKLERKSPRPAASAEALFRKGTPVSEA